ncbi:GIN domain-containing protein [Psychroserpens sp. MEBiC05023]
MKNITLFLLIIFGYSLAGFAQNSEKIKGDRNLTIKQTYIDDFSGIVVGEDFKIELFYNKKPSVEIETDENLHAYINIQVIDSVLTLTTTADIRPKKLNIKVNYGDSFSNIEVKGDAEVRSLTSLELTNASLKTSGSSRAYLNIKTDDFSFISTDKTKVKLNISATSVSAEISDNTKMDALINATEVKMDLYQRASADIEGTIDNLTLRADNNSKFNGKNFTSKTCTVTAEIASDVYLEVIENIVINASGASEVYLYGNPKITINTFTDTVKLQKKEK